MFIRIVAIAGLALAAALAVSAPAEALSSHDCSVKYKAAQDAGTLNGMKYSDFRKANCGADATATPAATTTPATTTKPATTATTASTDASEPNAANTATEPATATSVAPKGVVFPSKVDPKYASQSAGKQRMNTCLDQYHINKANNALGGLKWIQKGGGYYSLCNTKLKS